VLLPERGDLPASAASSRPGLAVGGAVVDRDVRPHAGRTAIQPASATGFSATRPVATVAT
jgi:hypothetical protein